MKTRRESTKGPGCNPAMIIKKIIGNLKDVTVANRTVIYLELEWYETSKRILHKRTNSGHEISLKFLDQTQNLGEGDVLYEDTEMLIVVQIQPCDTIVIKPASMYEMAYVCYEIGNKHLPLFYENGELLIPYEDPLLRLLQASGLKPVVEERVLQHQLKSTVAPHGHSNSRSLFSKIIQLTSPNE